MSEAEQDVDAADEVAPVVTLFAPKALAARGEPVVAALTASLLAHPFAGEQAAFLQAVQYRVERALMPADGVFGLLEDAFDDAVAVAWAVAEHVEHDQVIRAGGEVAGKFISVHWRYLVLLGIIVCQRHCLFADETPFR